jgi:hypothetical protein
MKKIFIAVILLFIFCFFLFNPLNKYEECVISSFDDYEIYDLKIYNKPIFIKENSHQLENPNFVPEWYLGYSSIFIPYNFPTIELRNEGLHSSRIEKDGISFLDSIYYKFKDIEEGRPNLRYKGFGKVCSRTIKIRNKKNKKEYLVFSLNSYEIKNGFLENSIYNPLRSALTIAFELDNNVYKSVTGSYSLLKIIGRENYSKILDIIDLERIAKLDENKCYEVINNNEEKNFDSKKLPKWLFDKVINK